ncbi:MAG: DUF5777 family beta-barrel protein [Bacteroidota bacterium]
MHRIILVFIVIIAPLMNAMAQDDLLSQLQSDQQNETKKVEATFKGTRIINGHSVEVRSARILQFIISHRFGRVNSGASELFGLDESSIRIGLEYGVTDNFDLGLGRSSFNKDFDFFAKYKLVSQQTGKAAFPLTITGFTSMTINSLENNNPERDLRFEHRVSYVGQVLIARKFSDNLSIQVTPTYIHRNLVPTEDDDNDLFSVGFGGRAKITKRLAINAEYFYQVNTIESLNSNDAFAIGVDIETGGHVFQLSFTNARSMIETGFISETSDDFFDGDLRFGFNISRAFQF